VLPYRTTNRLGYREYASNPARCAQRLQCTQSRNHQKLVTRHIWEDFKDAINANRLTDLGKRLYARRKETVERSFADAKELHGHRYAALPRTGQGAGVMPALGGLPEHEEDGAAAGQEGSGFICPIHGQMPDCCQANPVLPLANQPFRRKFPNSAPLAFIPEKPLISQQKNKTPEKSGVRQQSETPQ